MITEAIQKVLDISAPISIDIDGKNYMRKEYSPVLERHPDPLEINNLTGIADFILSNKEPWENLFIHVRDYNKAILYRGAMGVFNQRISLVESSSMPCRFQFGQKMDLEQFTIAVNSTFVQSDDRDYILKFISSIRVDNNATIEDDGITQTLRAKTGASSLIKDIPIRNILTLSPFRTFSDIEQPESKFIFRLKVNGTDLPTCSLHEADGEAWKQEAIKKIKAFFVSNVGADIPVIA